MNRECGICSKKSSSCCSKCKVAYYCSVDHQKQDWPDHKINCSSNSSNSSNQNPHAGKGERKQTPKSGIAASNPEVNPSQWSSGLTGEKAAEWFVDCFRMRADDDQVWSGGECIGLYSSYSERNHWEPFRQFHLFCPLAKTNGVIPEKNWSWELVIEKAKLLLGYAFEKSDAQEKYGSENVFSSLMGGRSLRFTGEYVYSNAVTEQKKSKQHGEELKLIPRNYGKGKIWQNSNLFESVGGVNLWKSFHEHLVVSLINIYQ